MRHSLYNRDNFPRLIVNHGPWDICANDQGRCAAIPTPEAEARGHLASHFGDMAYVRVTLWRELRAAAELEQHIAEGASHA